MRAYNETVSSIDGRVLVTARKMADLGVTDGDLEPADQLDRVTRQVQAPELVALGTDARVAIARSRTSHARGEPGGSGWGPGRSDGDLDPLYPGDGQPTPWRSRRSSRGREKINDSSVVRVLLHDREAVLGGAYDDTLDEYLRHRGPVVRPTVRTPSSQASSISSALSSVRRAGSRLQRHLHQAHRVGRVRRADHQDESDSRRSLTATCRFWVAADVVARGLLQGGKRSRSFVTVPYVSSTESGLRSQTTSDGSRTVTDRRSAGL